MLGVAGAAIAGVAAASWSFERRLRPHGAARRHGLRAAPPAPGGWPEPGAPLSPPEAVLPVDFGVRRVYVDAGHGAPGNTGNTSCFCVEEQEFTLVTARALADRLEATASFEVRLSREGERLVAYRDRVEEAAQWGAEAFLSLHSDVRGQPERTIPPPAASAAPGAPGDPGDPGDPERLCPLSLASPGFSVLWSDEGDASLVDRRRSLARATGRRMEETGLLPYGGAEYVGLYEPDTTQRGVFVDRHAPDKRIYVLRRTTMPAILIETHHALDPREAERWTEPRTLDAFAAAVAAALADTLAGPADPLAKTAVTGQNGP